MIKIAQSQTQKPSERVSYKLKKIFVMQITDRELIGKYIKMSYKSKENWTISRYMKRFPNVLLMRGNAN